MYKNNVKWSSIFDRDRHADMNREVCTQTSASFISSYGRSCVTTETPPCLHPGPHHLPCTPRLELWFARGSVAVTWSFVVPRDGKTQINRGALKWQGVGAGWGGVLLGFFWDDLTGWLTLRRKCEKFTVVWCLNSCQGDAACLYGHLGVTWACRPTCTDTTRRRQRGHSLGRHSAESLITTQHTRTKAPGLIQSAQPSSDFGSSHKHLIFPPKHRFCGSSEWQSAEHLAPKRWISKSESSSFRALKLCFHFVCLSFFVLFFQESGIPERWQSHFQVMWVWLRGTQVTYEWKQNRAARRLGRAKSGWC